MRQKYGLTRPYTKMELEEFNVDEKGSLREIYSNGRVVVTYRRKCGDKLSFGSLFFSHDPDQMLAEHMTRSARDACISNPIHIKITYFNDHLANKIMKELQSRRNEDKL